MKKLEKVVGSWAPLLTEEFKKPYMKELSKKIAERKGSLFLEFYPKGDLFQVFKDSDPKNIKVVFVCDKPLLEDKILISLWEHSKGDCSILVAENYDWLVKQGILFLPKYLSWDEEDVHREWSTFTEAVLLQLTAKKDVLVVTSDMPLAKMLFEFRPWIDRISEHEPWSYIEQWLKKKHNFEINWSQGFVV